MEYNEENKKIVEGKGDKIKQLLEAKGFQIVNDWFEKKDDEIKSKKDKKLSGEKIFFCRKNSNAWPQKGDAKGRTGYCLTLRSTDYFWFELRCGNSQRGYEEVPVELFPDVMTQLNNVCKAKGWKIDESLTNSKNKSEKHAGMHVVVSTESCFADSFDGFVEELDQWDKSNIALFNKYKELVKTKTAEEIIMEEKLSEIKDFLLNNHNIILHGAPGTGKTYLAKDIATKMLSCSKDEIGFVQFHQSYDYTDFVEGLRPVNQGQEKIGFELKEGVFKSFCRKALKNLLDSRKSGADLGKEIFWREKCKEFFSRIEDGETEIEDESVEAKLPNSFETKQTKNKFSIEFANDDSIIVNIPNNPKKNVVEFELDELVGVLVQGKPQKVKDVRDALGRNRHRQKDSYIFVIAQKIYDDAGKIEFDDTKKTERKNFVFIIDEINRGEMSKILGELFYSIDPGYRVKQDDLGDENKTTTIRTQYANLQKKPNKFDEALGIKDDGENENYGHFFVPENVYIIGTMNDIDRSVDSIDFAMRRRFAFKEITAKQSQESMFGNVKKWKESTEKDISPELLDELKNRMDNLNKKILDPKYHLGQAYQIGGAYFLKFAKYYDSSKKNESDAFKALWENHIEGVVREYLRGLDKDDKFLIELKNAYYGDKEPKKPGVNGENPTEGTDKELGEGGNA